MVMDCRVKPGNDETVMCCLTTLTSHDYAPSEMAFFPHFTT